MKKKKGGEKNMQKLNGWLWLLIALMWLLPLVTVDTGVWGPWISVIALVIIGIFELKG
jgi:hypothetical protein